MAAHRKRSLYTANRTDTDPNWGLLSHEHTIGQEHKHLTTKRADLAHKSSSKIDTYLSFLTYLNKCLCYIHYHDVWTSFKMSVLTQAIFYFSLLFSVLNFSSCV